MAVDAVGDLRRVLSTPRVRRNAAVALRGVDEAGLSSLLDAVSFGEIPRQMAPELPVQLARSAADFVQNARSLGAGVRPLTRPRSNIFDLRSIGSTDPEAISGTAASGTQIGEFLVEIGRLAAGQSNAGRSHSRDAASDIGVGANVFAIDIGGEAREIVIEVDATNTNANTLRRMAAAVNDVRAGVTAEIRSTQEDRLRLLIARDETGSSATFDMRDLEGDAVAATRVDQVQRAAENASFTINGEDFESETNTVELDEGNIVLELNQPTDEPVTIGVEPDADSQFTAVQGFIEQFNEFRTLLNEAEAFFNDVAVAALDSTLRQNDFELGNVGIYRSVNGTVEVDESRLRGALASDSARVRGALTGSNGMAAGAESLVRRVLDQSPLAFTKGSVVERLVRGGTRNFDMVGSLVEEPAGSLLAVGLLIDGTF